jgi:hypothetical protein
MDLSRIQHNQKTVKKRKIWLKTNRKHKIRSQNPTLIQHPHAQPLGSSSQKWPCPPQHPLQRVPPPVAPALFPNPIFPPICPSASVSLLPPAPPPPNHLLSLSLARLEPVTRPSRWSTAPMRRTGRFLLLRSFRDPILLAASGSSAGSTSPKP